MNWLLFFWRTALRDWPQFGFAFKDVSPHVKGAVAAAVFFNVDVAIVAGAYDVPVLLKPSCRKPAGARGIPVSLLILSQALQKIVQEFGVRVEVVAAGSCIILRPSSNRV